jgi:16S rRNA G966 N2-methylase RsmD
LVPELGDMIGDAENLSNYFNPSTFEIIYADPPYSEEDARNYGFPLINRNKVIKEAYKVLIPGGFLVWLDQVFPMYRKVDYKLVGTINIIRSTNHRVRDVFIFQKQLANNY